MVNTLHRRALAAFVTLGLAAGSLVGVSGAASADPVPPLTVSITGATPCTPGSLTQCVYLGATLTATPSAAASGTFSYAWNVSPVDTGESPLVSNDEKYSPTASHKSETLKVTVTDSADPTHPITSTGAIIQGGNVQTGQTTVEAGASFGITGTFFAASQPYTIIFPNIPNQVVTTDATGSFVATIAVPAGTKSSTPTISVQSALAGKITSTSIIVVPPASNPTSYATTPHISGTVQVGKGIQVELGSWTPGTVFKYQWQLDGRSIAGETTPRYGIRPTDVGHSLRIRVVGTSDAATVTSYSASVRVAPATFSSTPSLTIKGTLKRGHKLRAVVHGGFSPAATTKFAWYVNGIKVAGTSSTIIVKRTWKKKHVTVRLTGSKAGYTTVTKSYTTTKTVKK